MKLAAIPEEEHARLESLRSLHLLDTAHEERFDRLTALALRLFHAPIAYISLIDANRQWLKSQQGVPFCHAGRDTSFCAHAILQDEPLIVPDTLADDRFFDNAMVTGHPHVRFYAGVPLKGPGGHNIGTFCLMDIVPREWSDEEMRDLSHLAAIAEREMNFQEHIALQDRLLSTQEELLKSRSLLSKELSEAALYVESMLPARMESPVATDWLFIPSSHLGGDIFSYHWIDDDRLGIYLLDVCGHGVGAALLSVAVMHFVRTLTSRPNHQVESPCPAELLRNLNMAFPMEHNRDAYFTMWCGIYHANERRLVYSSAGHPPVLLYRRNGVAEPRQLGMNQLPIGLMPDVAYRRAECTIEPGDTLFLYSDGATELMDEAGTLLDGKKFAEWLADYHAEPPRPLDGLLETMRTWSGREDFMDDLSLVRFRMG